MWKPDIVLVVLTAVTAATHADSAADFQAVLDRWGKGDPQGYLETYAEDGTYFDPKLEVRVDGLNAMKKLLTLLTGKINIDRYEMISPKVQRIGDVAVLTYNPISHGKRPGGAAAVRWNSTAVCGRTRGKWKIMHSHWSFTKPELRSGS